MVACSERTPGRAVPDRGMDGTEGSGGPGTPSTSTDSSPKGDNPLISLDPCTLPTPSMKTTLGLTKTPQTLTLPSSKSCSWQVGDGEISNRFNFSIAIFPKTGIDDVVADGEKKPVTVGSRRAIQSLRAASGVCAISIEVTATSRVDMQATGAGSNDGSLICPKALAAAELIEPELPK
ncbi:DUF3558 family protein [Actinokineospora pegani]|uniref:DUF3558 family protein n=1 Tax=Actinokineospora pegani TaxID=2654637 RepID=UPI0022A69347|nr:DUF3558 family protein [Actinokineospora pegani]